MSNLTNKIHTLYTESSIPKYWPFYIGPFLKELPIFIKTLCIYTVYTYSVYWLKYIFNLCVLKACLYNIYIKIMMQLFMF